MLGNVAYAAKKRKKPVQKIPKASPPEGSKSNPSKRHRDRLNGELDKLTSLLPFGDDVRARLDKLSVLRLSVGYLKVKSFFNATMKKGSKGATSSGWSGAMGGNGHTASLTSNIVTSVDGVAFSEGDLLLQALNGFVLVVTAEGYVFYSSSTIQDYLGFHQSDVLHQSVFELIHTDDRALFRRQLHFALNPNQFDVDKVTESQQSSSDITTNVVTYDPLLIPPENSSFLERSFVCRFRCLLDNSSGFLALNFQGRLKYVHGQSKLSEDGSVGHPQLALFVVATPLQTPSILEIRSKTLIFQTKHKLDFTPLGVDTRGKVVLGYSEIEICLRGSGYQFIHAADMMYCADNHVRMIKTGESGLTVFRLLTKSNTWVWVQANARLVLKNGRPDFIVARQRALSNEEGEEHLRIRRTQLPFNFATGEALLYEVGPTLDPHGELPSTPKLRKVTPVELPVDPGSLLGCILQQDQTLYLQDPVPSPPPPGCSLNDVAFQDSHALVNVPGGGSWQHPHPASATPSSSSSLAKEETTMQDMMDTIQQIIGDSDLCSSLSVDPVELKDWEATLLRMSSTTEAGSYQFSDDLNDILNNDILAYVEEHLLKDTAGGAPELLDMPQAYLEPPAGGDGVLSPEQGFPWAQVSSRQEGQQQGPAGAQDGDSIRVSLKLTHMGPLVEDGRPTTGLRLEYGAPNGPGGLERPGGLDALGGVGGFDVLGSCDQARPVSKQNTYEPALYGAANQIHPSKMAQPIPSKRQPGIPIPPMGFQGRSGVNQLNQNSQWNHSVNKVLLADSMFETYGQNISNQQDFIADPTSIGSCIQGNVSLHTQNIMNQRQSWQQQQQQQQEQQLLLIQQQQRQLLKQQQLQQQQLQQLQHQQQLPAFIQNGHQNANTSYNQLPEFRQSPLPVVPSQLSQNSTSRFPKTPSSGYLPHGDLEPTSSSCMFVGVPVESVVSGLQAGQKPLGGGPCQRLVVPNKMVAAASCQLGPGSGQDLGAEQQTSQGCPIEGNGGFPFPGLPNGNTFYSDNNPTNCCDF